MLAFQPRGSGFEPVPMRYFFYKFFEAEDSHFRQYETPPPPFSAFWDLFSKIFWIAPKGPPFIFFDILQQSER